ncbi:MAG: hypothetical protein A2527_12775 [Candidatus Lambdaproteobacteria bacterium RIFOXYD2_FULL_50_16]|uniref:Nucleotidyl transferase domain-containing protein n=1 Tax=Candidatus Lambdaproteobacteria bacterium RIFOXYD2_FULL_50_16 TaxID=1817772 RepID=A0A1F6G9Q2_9PROT|nr:MAG: hypothetical protein A2527_12775 [Candidatus Lambdaproteobacteria bacterium RIFOXYD2_FULL_50_16]
MPGLGQAVVLVGGKGTRLGELTQQTPKPLLPVAGRPFIDYLLHWLFDEGVDSVVLSAGYLSEQFEQALNATEGYGGRVRLVTEPEPAGTGGALRHVEPLLADQFFLLNGDSLFKVRLSELAGLNADEPWIGKLALRWVPDVARYGSVVLKNRQIESFTEKGARAPGLINGGIYLLKREILREINQLPCSIETDLFAPLAAQGRLWGLEMDGYFLDIGVPEDYQRAQSEIPAQFGGNLA